ncbi:metallophosphoesterase family protein [Oceaniferula spumae]
MRTLAIGDIHGCLTALKTLVEVAGVTPEDTLITLGDYVDRGDSSRGVIDYLIELRKTHQLITLRGNHESMMEEARSTADQFHFWAANGGYQTLESFGVEDVHEIPKLYWKFLKSLESWYETENHIFVHAGLSADLPLKEQPPLSLYWMKFSQNQPHESGKTIVCGHTAQKDGLPSVQPGAVCIDTHVYAEDGWLTCLDVMSGEYWQANELGESRRGELDPVG